MHVYFAGVSPRILISTSSHPPSYSFYRLSLSLSLLPFMLTLPHTTNAPTVNVQARLSFVCGNVPARTFVLILPQTFYKKGRSAKFVVFLQELLFPKTHRIDLR